MEMKTTRDMMKQALAERSATALSCLPDAPYKTLLTQLHADMLAADAQQVPHSCGWNGCGKADGAGNIHDCAYPDCIQDSSCTAFEDWAMTDDTPEYFGEDEIPIEVVKALRADAVVATEVPEGKTLIDTHTFCTLLEMALKYKELNKMNTLSAPNF